MNNVSTDALADARYAGSNPEYYVGEDEPETALDDDLEALGNRIHDAWMVAHRIKDLHRIRRINGVIDALCDLEDMIEKLKGERY